jgi:hypothetical protein
MSALHPGLSSSVFFSSRIVMDKNGRHCIPAGFLTPWDSLRALDLGTSLRPLLPARYGRTAQLRPPTSTRTASFWCPMGHYSPAPLSNSSKPRASLLTLTTGTASHGSTRTSTQQFYLNDRFTLHVPLIEWVDDRWVVAERILP